MEEKTTECLYYMAFNSFLLQKPEFEVYFQLLKNQLESFPGSDGILSPKDKTRLDLMRKSFLTRSFSLFEGVLDFSASSFLPDPGKSEKPHMELVRDIYRSRESVIEPFTGPIREACFEYPVLDGFVDLMVQSGPCAHIIEVKTSLADHAIIGQVMKYYIGMCLKFNLKFFDEVKIVTICPGYDQAAVRGLKQVKATVLSLDTSTMNVTLL